MKLAIKAKVLTTEGYKTFDLCEDDILELIEKKAVELKIPKRKGSISEFYSPTIEEVKVN